MIYIREEDMNMDVQVGPQDEIEVAVNPVDVAKMDPNTVVVAKEEPKDSDAVAEFFVDAKDVNKYAKVTYQSFDEALEDIIECNEEHGMCESNTFVIMNDIVNESFYAGTLEYVTEQDEDGNDINIAVQVGPNKDEIKVSEDPQNANPVDAVKRQYGSVVVAKDGDDFFVDVEDTQKCADCNCESVIETLNGIIRVNQEAGMTKDNLTVVIGEGYKLDEAILEQLIDKDVNVLVEGTNIGQISGFNDLAKKAMVVMSKAKSKIKKTNEPTIKALDKYIASIEKTISDIDDEIKEVKDAGGVSKGRAAKVIVSCMSRYAGCATIGAVGGATSASVVMAPIAALIGGKEAVKAGVGGALTGAGISGAVLAICGIILGGVEAAASLKDYITSLETWKKGLKDQKKELEAQKKALEKANK